MAAPRYLPMLAIAGELPRDPQGWAFEPKWDGMRLLVAVEEQRVSMWSRRGRAVTDCYPELADLASCGADVVLDGEAVALDESGRPSFQLMQERMTRSSAPPPDLLARVPVTYVPFDLLWLGGHPTIDLPFRERRRLLTELAIEGRAVRLSPSYEGVGQALLDAASEVGLEGVVAKRLDGTYQPGRRSPSWIKVALAHHDEFVVGGWLPGEGGRVGRIGSLLLGAYDESDPPALVFVGSVGSGFTDATLRVLHDELGPRQRATSPFAGALPKVPRLRTAVFVEPDVVVDVAYRERTADGLLRQPSFKGLRPDKAPVDVRLIDSGRGRRAGR